MWRTFVKDKDTRSVIGYPFTQLNTSCNTSRFGLRQPEGPGAANQNIRKYFLFLFVF
jgi:hypothetical protein